MGRVFMLMVFMSTALSCGDGYSVPDDRSQPVADDMPGSQQSKKSQVIHTASITGTVKLGVEVPRIPLMKIDGDIVCNQMNPEGIRSDRLVVDADRNVRWALVHVTKGLGETSHLTPNEPVVLHQRKCMYDPHVFGIMVGQVLEVKNSDKTIHNAHFLSFKNEQPILAPRPIDGWEHRFRSPELPVRIKCDIHPWMNAWAGVFDHPYFSVTSEAGRFALEGLSAGRYTVEVWHEMYESVVTEVQVTPGEKTSLQLELKAEKER